MRLREVELLAFDADDTLWDCQSHFNKVEDDYFSLLAPYGERDQLYEKFFATEQGNMATLGYGSKAFTISLVENAIRVSHGTISAQNISRIIDLGKSLLEMPSDPLPGVEETLDKLGHLRKIVFTKGEIIEQENKLRRSGLLKYFADVVVVSDKTEESYWRICRMWSLAPRNLIMIGNSFKSDIAPALSIGSYAMYIPYHVTWRMEHSEEFEHERLIRLSKFEEIIEYFY